MPLRRAVAILLCVATISTGLGWQERTSAATPGALHVDFVIRPNGAIALVGDSLSYAYFNALDEAFHAQQWGPVGLEARSARRTIVTMPYATSGLDAVRRLRAQGIDPLIWIVALGTNDIKPTYGVPGAAADLIDTMMEEIGAGRRVVWVNVFATFDMPETAAFNAALVAATARHPLLSIADWYSVAVANPQWFLDDGVHNTLAGAAARNAFVAAAPLLPVCPQPFPPAHSGSWTTVIATAVATATAMRICRV